MKEIGEELKKARLSRRIRLKSISKRTKINQKILEALEAGDFQILPEPYIKAFIKTYAKEVGLDEREILKKYESLRKGEQIDKNSHESHNLPTGEGSSRQ